MDADHRARHSGAHADLLRRLRDPAERRPHERALTLRLPHELVRRMILGREREAELHQRFAASFTPDFIRPPVAIFVRSVSAWLSSSSVWSSRSFASPWPSWSASVFAVP